jgi:hypothetical protein
MFQRFIRRLGAGRPSRQLATAAIVFVTALALAGPRSARADGGPVDITGQTVNVHLQMPYKDSGKMHEIDIPSAFLPAQAQAMLNTPLSDTFNQAWSVTPDKDGKTMRDRSCDTIKSAITHNIHSSSYSAYDVDCNLPTTGALRAQVSGKTLVLSYWLAHNDVVFRSTTPFTCAHGTIFCPTDPKFELTFDAELQITGTIPDQPCDMAPKAQVLLHNANISGDDVTADIGEAFQTLKNLWNDEPLAIFQAAEGTLDSQQVSISLAPLKSSFDALSAGCRQAQTLGFLGFEVLADSSNGLLFRLDHRLDLAPLIDNPRQPNSNFPSLFSPTINAAQPQAQAGGQVSVTGSYFQASDVSGVQIEWTDTLSGVISESDIRWGPKAGTLQDVTQQRSRYDGKNHFEATGLTPNTAYEFEVRDCNLLTCTPWGTKSYTTSGQGTNQVTLYLDSIASEHQIGMATLVANGTFDAAASLPLETSAGKHTIVAIAGNQVASTGLPVRATAPALLGAPASSSSSASGTILINPALIDGLTGAGGQQATTTITVVAAGQGLQPAIEIVDPNTNAVFSSLMQSYSYTVRGQGFAPGQVTLSVDGSGGPSLGVATAASDGSFELKISLPYSLLGSHSIVAFESANGQSIQASDPVSIQMLPR